jgi:hypothetical protein
MVLAILPAAWGAHSRYQSGKPSGTEWIAFLVQSDRHATDYGQKMVRELEINTPAAFELPDLPASTQG